MVENEETVDAGKTEDTTPVYTDGDALRALTEGLEKLNSGVEDVEDVEDKQPVNGDKDSEKESDEELESEDDGSEVDGTEDTEPIPQEQVDIARKLGYADEDIIELAEKHPERLENMVKMYQTPKPVPQAEQKVVVREGPKKEKVERLAPLSIEGLDELEPETAAVVKSLLKTNNSLIERLNKQQDALESLGEQTGALGERDKIDKVQKIDSFFDEASEHLPELGKIGSLTNEQAQTRIEIYGLATVLANSRGLSERKALEEATYLYGLSKVDIDKLSIQAEERVKEKLNKQKKRMSPRPGGKKRLEVKEHGRTVALDFLSQGLKELSS